LTKSACKRPHKGKTHLAGLGENSARPFVHIPLVAGGQKEIKFASCCQRGRRGESGRSNQTRRLHQRLMENPLALTLSVFAILKRNICALNGGEEALCDDGK
jgi:hypothetical protein